MIDHQFIRSWISDFAARMDDEADALNRLDAALGDGDYGASMKRGLAATTTALAETETDSVGKVLMVTGTTLVSAIGGTSGPLVGTLFVRAGLTLGDSTSCEPADLCGALRTGANAVMELGGAALGDKTMLDALLPSLDTFDSELGAGSSLAIATSAVSEAANTAAAKSAELEARRGRASYTGTGGLGHVDPGAKGMALLFASLNAVSLAREAA